VIKLAPTLPKDNLLMNLCGRGDKDIFTVALGVKMWAATNAL
jgi:tryptophan synthase beta subunit